MDALVRFEREGVEGLVPVNVSLAHAARRFGVRFDDCKPAANEHNCTIIVTSGIANIAPLTETETEHFAAHGRRSNERVACEATIIKSGEISVMTEEKKQQTKKTAAGSGFQAEFNALPLDKKFANLLQMEVATINEAVKYVADSSMKMFEKVGDVISDFGVKVESEVKKATANDAAPAPETPKAEKPKPKSSTKRKPPTAKA